AVLHSSRTQRERESALSGFRNGRYEVMVATDIAARGIDVEQISHVINFDVPHHPEDYVHRIGRTGRALAVGDAFTIMTGEDVQEIVGIERFLGQKIPRVKLEGFAYESARLLDQNPPPAFGARRPRGSWSFGYGSRRREAISYSLSSPDQKAGRIAADRKVRGHSPSRSLRNLDEIRDRPQANSCNQENQGCKGKRMVTG